MDGQVFLTRGRTGRLVAALVVGDDRSVRVVVVMASIRSNLTRIVSNLLSTNQFYSHMFL